MEGYRTLTEAAAMAQKVCSSWYGDETEDTYGIEELSYIAQIVDIESPLFSDEQFYAVFPDGEIGIMCTFDKSITRLFIPSDSDFVPAREDTLNEDDEMISDSTMPHFGVYDDGTKASYGAFAGQSMDHGASSAASVKTAREFYFCTKCGAKVKNGYKFCPACGQRIEVL